MTRLYDVRRRLNMGTSRITYVVDKAGVIRHVAHNEVSMGSHIRDALKTLDALAAEAGE